MNANYRNFALWVIIFLLVLALVTLFQSPGQKAPSSEITFSQLGATPTPATCATSRSPVPRLPAT